MIMCITIIRINIILFIIIIIIIIIIIVAALVCRPAEDPLRPEGRVLVKHPNFPVGQSIGDQFYHNNLQSNQPEPIIRTCNLWFHPNFLVGLSIGDELD